METKQKELPLKVQVMLKVPYYAFGVSLGLGTLLLLIHLSGKEFELLVLGFFYVCTAVIINLIIVMVLVGLSIVYKEYQRAILLNTSIMLLNIPIAIGYIYLVFDYNGAFHEF